MNLLNWERSMSRSSLKRMLTELFSIRHKRRTTRARLNVEGLSDRRVPAALTATLSDTGVLHVDGTEGRDNIIIRVKGDVLTVKGTPIQMTDGPHASVSAALVKSIEVNGLGGNDTIDLRGVAIGATVHGNAGDDKIFGGSGVDDLNGDAGNDMLSGGAGNDLLNGGDDKDNLSGGAGDDTIHGDDGNDRLDGGAGNDDLQGDVGDDRLFGRDGSDKLAGGSGRDSEDGGNDDDNLTGEAGDDSLNGGSGNDHLAGEDGDDSLLGGTGDDDLDGGIGDDRLRGGHGRDSNRGGTGDDDLLEDQDDDHGIDSGSDDDLPSASSEVEGVITAIDTTKGEVTIRRSTGDLVVVTVKSTTKLERNDAHVTLAAFQVGDQAEAKCDTHKVALKLEAVSV
jgi:Ca2+-binding RTX toxin-like protein